MGKAKICGICKMGIDTERDYIKVGQYREGDLWAKAYYHIECFKNKITTRLGTQKLQEKCMDVLNNLSSKMS
jgi:hypothetical protein